MNCTKWDQRIKRADQLTTAHPFANDVMRFYKHVAGFQKALYFYFENACAKEPEKRVPGSLRNELDLFTLLPKFHDFLSYVATIAPKPIAQSALNLNDQGVDEWRDVVNSCWGNAPNFQPAEGQTEALLGWIFLQPYAEHLADHTEQTIRNGAPTVCPVCGGRPQVGVLRPEGDGAKRSLVCGLCATEWEFRRIVCAACAEEDVQKLAVYSADQFSHVQIDACDSCHHYIKTVNLAKNGHAVPVVDELAAIPLSLWAIEHGYVKLQTNILGI